MIEIRVHNVVCHVQGADARQHARLSEALSYRQDGYMFAPAYKAGTWDGYVRLYNAATPDRPFGKFWTGLLHRAVTALRDDGAEVAVHDDREAPPPQPPIVAASGTDRYYQADAEEAAIQRTRGIIKVATAGGKTAIAGRIMARLNLPSMFVAHKINLLTGKGQAKDTFERMLGARVGVVQGDNRRLERFNVATVQTLDSILWSATDSDVRRFVENECRVLMVDEAHHAASPSYKRVLGRFLAAYNRYGFSATPHDDTSGMPKGKGMEVEAMFGRVIYSKERSSLTEEGYLAKAHVFFV